MDCRRVAELLPWYLNGTLDAAEREALAEHLGSCPACRAELAEAEAAALLFGGHPPAALLVDYAFERPDVPRDLVAAHLGGCAACAEELAMARASRDELERQPRREQAAEIVPFRRPSGPRPVWRAAAAAAAVVGLLGLGSGLWSWRALDRQESSFAERQQTAERRIAELEAEVRALERARPNVPIHDLWPEGTALRSPGAGPIRLPAVTGPPATLVLNSQLEGGHEVALLELRDADGRLLQSLNGLRAGPAGGFTLSLPLARLPRGRLEILLLAEADGEPLETYAFELY